MEDSERSDAEDSTRESDVFPLVFPLVVPLEVAVPLENPLEVAVGITL